MSVRITKLPNSEIEIEGEISAEEFERERPSAVAHMSEHVEIKGFRKGHIPESVLEERLGAMAILEEMAERALSAYYPKLVAEEKLDVIGRPQITITKLAKGNPLGFKIKTAVLPEIKLPDYKKLSQKIMGEAKMEVTVTDEEMEKVIGELLKTHTHGEGEEKKIPELNDEFAKHLGDFESLADLRAKIKENLKLEKERKEQDRRRVAAVETIMEKMEVELPEVLVERELSAMIEDMKASIAQMGMKFEDYLKQIGKTEEDLKKEGRSNGEKRAKFGLVMSTIAKLENIEAPEEELERELGHVLKRYPGADPASARNYVAGVLTNEKVFQFLEGPK